MLQPERTKWTDGQNGNRSPTHSLEISRNACCNSCIDTFDDETGASRRYLKGVPPPTLMLELGHESLATTQDYLADVRREDEAKKAVADADFVPEPRLVSGTDGD
jgi:hypothetical protein